MHDEADAFTQTTVVLGCEQSCTNGSEDKKRAAHALYRARLLPKVAEPQGRLVAEQPLAPTTRSANTRSL